MRSEDERLIPELAVRLGVVLSPGDVDRLAGFADLFLRWNSRINLAGEVSAEELVGKHFLDSFAAARFIPDGARVIDVGSGGGLPVLPLAIIGSGASFEIHEPTAKKVAFLRTAVRELNLGARVKVFPDRVRFPPDLALRRSFDIALSRATFSPVQWLSLGRDLVREEGHVLVFGTHEERLGGWEPLHTLAYGPGRRILVFGATLRTGA